MKTKLKNRIWLLFLAAIFFVMPVYGGCDKKENVEVGPGNGPVEQEPEEEVDEVLMNFQIISDTHYNYENDPAMKDKFHAVCEYNAENFPQSDALVVAGDFTVWGTEEQYADFFGDIAELNTAPTAIVAMGNHEYEFSPNGRIGANMFPERSERYRRYVGNLLQGAPLENMYYDRWIGGYHFIVLNSENWVDGSGKAYISDAQLEWFENALKENADLNKPIFVITHQPLDNTVDRSSTWGIGAQAERIKEILSDYPQSIVFSGHLHNGYIGYDAVYNAGYGTLIDLPAFQYNELCNKEATTALGYHVEVYKNKTVLTPVDYAAKQMLTDEAIVLEHSVTRGANAKSDVACDVIVDGETETALNDGDITSALAFRKNEKVTLRLSGETQIAGVRLRTDPKVNEKYAIDAYGVKFTRDSSYENSVWGGCTVQANGKNIGTFTDELPVWGKCFAALFLDDWLKDLGWIYIEAPCKAQEVEIVFTGNSIVSEIALVAEK